MHLFAQESPDAPAKAATQVSTMAAEDLDGWDSYPPEVKGLVQLALGLTQKNLGYDYGSADPTKGGMDCSGTIYYLLHQAGIKEVPRQANEFYIWVRKSDHFHAVLSTNNSSFELDDLKPGDLLFWTGTYDVDRDPPITHIMLYLGRRKTDQGRVMMGASEGRYYQGKSQYGVSIFDFLLPGFPPPKSYKNGPARFVGYASIPGLLTTAQPPVPATP